MKAIVCEPPAVVTTILVRPAAPALGVMTLSVVSSAIVKLAGIPLIVTADVSFRFSPAIVIDVPPVTAPWPGSASDKIGGGGTIASCGAVTVTRTVAGDVLSRKSSSLP